MKIKSLVPKNPILVIEAWRDVSPLQREKKDIYISRITETTILSIDSDAHETLWRRDNGKLKKHISLSTDWYIPQTYLDTIEVIAEGKGTVHAGKSVYFSGFRPRFNDKGIEVFDVPKHSPGTLLSDWLKELNFQIEVL